jgi:SHS2 domain-containing protein
VSYEFLDDAPPADVGFVARGETVAECFQAAVDATLACMPGNPEALRLRGRRQVHVQGDGADLALLKLLDELVYYKDAESLFLRATSLRVTPCEGRWTVDAVLEGEEVDPERHERSGDVKAVTMHRLDVRRTDAGWEATVVLDV